MIDFVGTRRATNTPHVFAFTGFARFEPSTLEVTWEARVSTAEGAVALQGVARDVTSPSLTKASAMQAVADAIDQQFGLPAIVSPGSAAG